jgi:hypothetical protein
MLRCTPRRPADRRVDAHETALDHGREHQHLERCPMVCSDSVGTIRVAVGRATSKYAWLVPAERRRASGYVLARTG